MIWDNAIKPAFAVTNEAAPLCSLDLDPLPDPKTTPKPPQNHPKTSPGSPPNLPKTSPKSPPNSPAKSVDGFRLARIALLLAFLIAIFFVLYPRASTSPEEQAALAAGRRVVVFWDRHSGHEHEARKALIEEFNRSQDKYFVRAVPVGFNAAMEKLLTSTAGGAPPDIFSLDTTFIAQLAPQGLFLPLDDFMKSEPSLAEEKFFPFCWDMCHFDGHVWAVPMTTDSYCLLWNKALFRKAGLDPERAPRTLEELKEYAARLTIRAEDGTVEQMGFLPWLPWDLSFMWGGLFGGTWYDNVTGRVACGDDQAIMDAYAWQASFAVHPGDTNPEPYAIDPDQLAAFSKGLGEYQSASNPFYAGKVAMITEGEWQSTFIQKYAPGLDWGVAPIPQPAGAPARAYGPAGVGDVIPATARNVDGAKAYLKWFYAPRLDTGVSPASDFCYAIHNIPPRIEEAQQERFVGNPKFKIFVDQFLSKDVVTFPVMPVTQFMADQIERQRERVLFRVVSAEQAAKEIDEMSNHELARVREMLDRRAE